MVGVAFSTYLRTNLGQGLEQQEGRGLVSKGRLEAALPDELTHSLDCFVREEHSLFLKELILVCSRSAAEP